MIQPAPETGGKKPEKIQKPHLLVTEGADAHWFSVWACQAFELQGFQVINFGGIKQLPTFLKTLRNLPGFDPLGPVHK